MSPIRTEMAEILLVLILCAAQETTRVDLVALEDARAEHVRELEDLKAEHESRRAAILERHRQNAERAKAAASKKADLELAVAWERLQRELQGGPPKESDPKPDPPAPVERGPREGGPREVEKARSECSREIAEQEGEHRRKRRSLREKRRQAAEQGKAAATRKGDLKLALAWQEFGRELEPKISNLAPGAKVSANMFPGGNAAPAMVDGNLGNFWYSGGKNRQKPDWARLDLNGVKTVLRVRLYTPVGRNWNINGHEPLDYELSAKLGGKVKLRVPVRGGDHPRAEVQGDKRTQWIEIDLKSEVEASEIELICSRTSGANFSPIIFEVEILGEE